MSSNYIPPAWPSTIERGVQASYRLSSDLDGRNANVEQRTRAGERYHKRKRTRAGERYHKRKRMREAALVESIATHGIK